MDNQSEQNRPLVDFSSPKKVVDSLSENKDVINEKVENFNKKASEAAKTVFNKSVELAGKVLENSDRIAGGAIALGGAGAAFLSYAVLGESILDPNAVHSLFGDAPRMAQILSSAGAFTTFSYLHVIGRNIMNRRDAFDPKGMQ